VLSGENAVIAERMRVQEQSGELVIDNKTYQEMRCALVGHVT
jgi:hypothetical protein